MKNQFNSFLRNPVGSILLVLIFLGISVFTGCNKNTGVPSFCTVSFETDIGYAPEMIFVESGSTLTNNQLPLLEVKGYVFVGWFIGETEVKAGEYVVTKNETFKARWTPKNNTPYIVRHLKQNINLDGYDEVTEDEEKLSGTTDSETAAVPKKYEGFIALAFDQKMIKADGVTVVEIKYDRNDVTFTFDLDGGSATKLTDGKLTGKYGTKVPSVKPKKENAYFCGWNEKDGKLPEIFDADANFIALWSSAGISVTFEKENDISIKAEKSEERPDVWVFTVDGDFYFYTWKIDGKTFQEFSNNVFEVDVSDFVKGTYVITVVAVQGSNYRSATAFLKIL